MQNIDDKAGLFRVVRNFGMRVHRSNRYSRVAVVGFKFRVSTQGKEETDKLWVSGSGRNHKRGKSILGITMVD